MFDLSLPEKKQSSNKAAYLWQRENMWSSRAKKQKENVKVGKRHEEDRKREKNRGQKFKSLKLQGYYKIHSCPSLSEGDWFLNTPTPDLLILKSKDAQVPYIKWHSIHILFFWGGLFRVTPRAYRGSQARGRTRATAATLRHSHSNARSKPRL